MTASRDQRPPASLLQIVHGGEPTAEELAALVTAIAARGSTGPADATTAAPWRQWSARADALRRPLRPGPGAWRAVGRVPGTRTRASW